MSTKKIVPILLILIIVAPTISKPTQRTTTKTMSDTPAIINQNNVRGFLEYGEYRTAILLAGVPVAGFYWGSADLDGDGAEELLGWNDSVLILDYRGLKEKVSVDITPSTRIVGGYLGGNRIIAYASIDSNVLVVINGSTINQYSVSVPGDVEVFQGKIFVAGDTQIYYLDSGTLIPFSAVPNVEYLRALGSYLAAVNHNTTTILDTNGNLVATSNYGSVVEPLVVDFDRDNTEELILANTTKIVVFDPDTLSFSELYGSYDTIASISAGQLDGSGNLEVVVVSSTGVFAVRQDSSILILNSTDTIPRFYDYDGDGIDEGIAVIEDYLKMFWMNGTQITLFPKDLYTSTVESMMVDLDGDSKPEYSIFSSYWGADKIFVFKLKRKAIIPEVTGGAKPKVKYEVAKYHNYSEIISILEQLHQQYPELTELIPFGASYGLDNPYQLYAIKITSPLATNKPAILIIGAHHARELITAEAALWLAVNLTEQYYSDPTIELILNNFVIYIIPVLNAGGHDYALFFDWLRKNLDPVDEDQDGVADEDPPEDTNGDGLIDKIYKYTSNGWIFWGFEGDDDDGDGRPSEDPPGGVDLNRNYNYSWTNKGSYGIPDTDVYSGEAPLSEWESYALANFMKSIKPVLALSLHSGEETIFYPWGVGYRVVPDYEHVVALASIMQDASGFAAMESSSIYEAYGVWDDYTYGYIGTLAFTPEIFYNDSWPQGEGYSSGGEYYYRLYGIKWYFNPMPNAIIDVNRKVLRMFVAAAYYLADNMFGDVEPPTANVSVIAYGNNYSFIIDAEDQGTYVSGIGPVTLRTEGSSKIVFAKRDYATDMFRASIMKQGTIELEIADRMNNTIHYYTTGRFEVLNLANNSYVGQKFDLIWSSPINYSSCRYEVYVDGELYASLPSGITRIHVDATNSSAQLTVELIAYVEYLNGSSETLRVYLTLNVDSSPPTITVSGIPNGSIVPESIVVGIETTDDVGVDHYEVFVDDNLYYSGANPQVEIVFESSGPHTIKFIAYDLAGNRASVSYKVIADLEAPIITVLEPQNNSKISEETLRLVANISDDIGVDKYEVYLNGELVEEGQETTINTTITLSSTENTITIIAKDKVGHTTKTTIKITYETSGEGGKESTGEGTSGVGGVELSDLVPLIVVLLVIIVILLAVLFKAKR